MKKPFLGLLAIFAITSMASAQELRLNAFSMYVFDDKVDSYYSSTDYFEGKVLGGLQWGGGLELKLDKTKSLELKYLRQDTEAPIYYWDRTAGINGKEEYTNFDLATNYILLGGNKYFPLANPKIEPYFGGGLGMCILNLKDPDNGNSDSKVKFAWDLHLGTNIMLSDKVGLKLHASMMSAVQSVGGGFYFGTGGAGAGVSTYSSFLQFGLGGGLTFNLGEPK
jgi:hypothetical protein